MLFPAASSFGDVFGQHSPAFEGSTRSVGWQYELGHPAGNGQPLLDVTGSREWFELVVTDMAWTRTCRT